MNIQFPNPVKAFFGKQVEDEAEKRAAHLAAPKNGPRGGRPLSDGQYSRKLRRVRRADSAAVGRKSRRNAFKQHVEQFHGEHDLRGIARVYLLGHGNEHMRRNVRKHVEGMALALVKAQGGRVTDKKVAESLAAIRGQLLELLVAWGDVDQEEAVELVA